MDELDQRLTKATRLNTTKPVGAVSSAFEMGKELASKADLLPELALTGLVIRTDLPVPKPMRSHKGKTKYDHVLERLEADGMSVTGIPKAYSAALSRSAGHYLKNHPEIARTSKFRVLRVDSSTIGVWRIKRDTKDR